MSTSKISKPRVTTALKLYGDGFDPNDATGIIGLQPTRTVRKGDRRVQTSPVVFDHDRWEFRIPEREEFHLESILVQLLDAVEPHKKAIHEAIALFGLTAEIAVVVYNSSARPSAYFTCDTIRRLAEMNVALDIDLM